MAEPSKKTIKITVEDDTFVHTIEVPHGVEFRIEQTTTAVDPFDPLFSVVRQEIDEVRIIFKPLRDMNGIAYYQNLEQKEKVDGS